jgi:hypothetical protein
MRTTVTLDDDLLAQAQAVLALLPRATHWTRERRLLTVARDLGIANPGQELIQAGH